MSILSIPLEALLRVHDQYSGPNVLSDVLGDGYLYAHSPVFARVRDAAIQEGYRFAESESDLWHDYQAMPLLSLQKILSVKTIPYFGNISVLRDLHAKEPQIELPTRLLYEVLKRNYVFHETSHCVAYSVVENRGQILRHFQSKKERFVVSAFLQEAFANSMERLSTAIAGSKTYAFFMNMNNYVPHDPKGQEFWESALDKLGFDRLFVITFLAYLGLNLQGRGQSFAKERILEIAGLSSRCGDLSSLLDQLLDKEIRLSEVFREETTRGYFRLYGCEQELLAVREARLLENIGIEDDLLDIVDKLAAVIVLGTQSLLDSK